MSEQEIKNQIEIINSVTQEAIKSKESALQILIDAGIIEEPGEKKPILE